MVYVYSRKTLRPKRNAIIFMRTSRKLSILLKDKNLETSTLNRSKCAKIRINYYSPSNQIF